MEVILPLICQPFNLYGSCISILLCLQQSNNIPNNNNSIVLCLLQSFTIWKLYRHSFVSSLELLLWKLYQLCFVSPVELYNMEVKSEFFCYQLYFVSPLELNVMKVVLAVFCVSNRAILFKIIIMACMHTSNCSI